MRRALWLLAGPLLLGSATLAHAEETSSGNFFTRLFPWGKAKSEPPKDDPKIKPKDPQPDLASAVQIKIDAAKTAYFERVKVCNKLREVALQTDDDGLLRKAEQLEIRVWDAYQNQMKRLAQNNSALSPEEQVFEDRLPAEASGRAGARPAAAPTASRRDP